MCLTESSVILVMFSESKQTKILEMCTNGSTNIEPV